MRGLTFERGLRRILLIGAHSDDIEIGCGGTVLRLVDEQPDAMFRWVVFGAADQARADEARQSARALLGSAAADVEVHGFRDSYLPGQFAEVKDTFEALKRAFDPDLVLVHTRDDAHQDHRLLAELAWNTFRSHAILEYEIPKYDGDLGRPNFYVPLTEALSRRKVEHVLAAFPSQRSRQWFTADTFWALLRLRGVECAVPFAEAFYARKLTLR